MGLCFYCFSLLLFLCSTQMRYSAEGRSMFKSLEVTKGREAEGMVMFGSMIGSRPPKCERRCISCGHCEAIQVPVVPQAKSGVRHFSKTINSRGDDSWSNYKPMNWKCKCGDMILNP